jgi:hypothetical protein
MISMIIKGLKLSQICFKGIITLEIQQKRNHENLPDTCKLVNISLNIKVKEEIRPAGWLKP